MDACRTFSLYISNTTNWVSMQIDEVIFGGDESNSPTLRPEDAPYRFTPDTVALHEDFSTPLPEQNINIGREFVTQSGWRAVFSHSSREG